MRRTVERLNVDGVQLEYRTILGDPTLPTLVLLHEGLGCVALWRDFPDSLAAATGCPVFAYSRAGYGGSDPIVLPRPLNYMSVEAEDVLPRVLECAGISHYHLVGHSDGATIALEFAANARDPGLQSVVVLAPHVFTEDCAILAITAMNQSFDDGDLRKRLEKYHGRNVDCAFRGWCDSWLHPQFKNWSVEANLTKVTVPVLQFQGKDDEYGTLEQLYRIEKRTQTEVQTVIFDNCGHSPQQDKPAETVAIIREFCS
ncbi:MAG: alpha/beta hydrolase [Proteobacteria bacterium]|nr:alpha/beta hydrolase [Pseudomonadota bacterium]